MTHSTLLKLSFARGLRRVEKCRSCSTQRRARSERRFGGRMNVSFEQGRHKL
jgi:hypothetical protein